MVKPAPLKKPLADLHRSAHLLMLTPGLFGALLTNGADMTRWNSTLISFDGTISAGEKVQLVAKIAPDRTFKIKVKSLNPEQEMIWVDGAAPFFRGVRTYTLEQEDGKVRFSMTEKIGGLMFPMAAGSLPSFDEAFEQYAADLKKEAELIQKTKN